MKKHHIYEYFFLFLAAICEPTLADFSLIFFRELKSNEIKQIKLSQSLLPPPYDRWYLGPLAHFWPSIEYW